MDQAATLRQLVGKDSVPVKRTQVITVTSGKGGVGKTSLSVNLALALAKMGRKVLLFDADLGLANINVLLGVIPKFNLYHVVKGHKDLKDIIIHTPEGVDIIAGASGYSLLANLGEGERNKLIQEFDKISGYDVLLIDTGAGVGSNVVGFTLAADSVLVVTTPEPTAITDAYGIIKSIVAVDSEKNLRLVVNRANSSLEGRKVAERIINICSQFLQVEVENVGFVFDDEVVSRSVRRQKPFFTLYPKSKASGCLSIVAARLVNAELPPDETGESTQIGSFFRRVFSASR